MSLIHLLLNQLSLSQRWSPEPEPVSLNTSLVVSITSGVHVAILPVAVQFPLEVFVGGAQTQEFISEKFVFFRHLVEILKQKWSEAIYQSQNEF